MSTEEREHHGFVTQRQLRDAIADLREEMFKMEASQQGQIDAITAELGNVQTGLASLSADLGTAQTTLQAEIDALAAGTPANLSNLQSVVDALGPAVQAADAAAQALGALQPTPAPPTP